MKYTFNARGHKNILANHKNTLEFIKDAELSVSGDCIVGVGAEFSTQSLKKIVSLHKRLRMRIIVGKYSEEIEFTANRRFNSKREIVLRLSEFSSDRTLGFRASKSSKQIDRKLVEKMRNPDQQIIVEIEPVITAIIFDLDNTLVEINNRLEYAHEKVAQMSFERYGVYGPTSMKLMLDIDLKFSLKGINSSPIFYDRHGWFKEYFKILGISVDKNDIGEYVNLYWHSVHEIIKPMLHAAKVLKELKKNYKIGVMTDSDGAKTIKLERFHKSGLQDFVDVFMTSDDSGVNKPNKKFYSKILKELDVKPEECVMVGDKPQVDLIGANKLGMRTIWIKYGYWTSQQGNTKFDYVDYEIMDLIQILKIIRGL